QNQTGFLVMDYMPGGTLRQRFAAGMALPLETILPYTTQIAEALDYAHNQGVIHQALRPEKLLVGHQEEIALAGFYLASAYPPAENDATVEPNRVTAYLAPEQLQQKPSPTSDQYALGIIVYEWLCGDRPFHGSFIEITAQHIHAAPPLLSQRLPGFPPAIEQVVMKSLAKDPQWRFPTTVDFATALEQAWLYPNKVINPSTPLPVQGPARATMPPPSPLPQRSTQPQQQPVMPQRSTQPQQQPVAPQRSTQPQQPVAPQPVAPQPVPVIAPPNPNLPVSAVPALPRPSTAHISWPTFSLTLSDRQAIGSGTMPQERLTITGQIAQTQPGPLPVTSTQPLATVPLDFFQQPSKSSVVLNVVNTSASVANAVNAASTTGIVRSTGAMAPVNSASGSGAAGSKPGSGSGMQIVRSSGPGTPAKTTTGATSTSTSTSDDGRKLGVAALVITLLSSIAISPNVSVLANHSFTTHQGALNAYAALFFIGEIVAFIMGCVAVAKGSRTGSGASKAGGWSIALSIIVITVEIIFLAVLYSNMGMYNIVTY
ncbi:MAG TPA: serine/threonine-protein kinase, partial [Ktedonobacteraceae bacterium]|nr:serine/threonine-protein kinase [Ktedonobacteraceae bacterium]